LADVIGDAAIAAGAREATAFFHKPFILFPPTRLAGFQNSSSRASYAFYYDSAYYVNPVNFRLLCLRPCALLHPAASNFVSTSNAIVKEIVGEAALDAAIEKERRYLLSLRRR
jgi:hypothetical protein